MQTPNWNLNKQIREECGVFGIFAPKEDVSKMCYYALYALQHRGQEAAGIAVTNRESILVCKDLGLVSQVFDEQMLSTMKGDAAIAHCRYTTQGATTWRNAQPTFHEIGGWGSIALAHNGNLINTQDIITWGIDQNLYNSTDSGNSDSEIMTNILAAMAKSSGLIESAKKLLPNLSGAYSLVFIDKDNLYAARDPAGIRPLELGELSNGGWVVASETVALDIIGAKHVRSVTPGELLVINETGVESIIFAAEDRKSCIFEHIYLARPDSVLDKRLVNSTRMSLGKYLAKEYPVEADLVIPVPESGTPAAIGYAQKSKIPFAQGLIKNSYIGRTFIQPSQTLRQRGIRLKLNPMKEVIEGKKLVVVDDSIVRGNTQKALIKMLRQAGAKSVHVRIASPPVKWPCFYGIDFASHDELIANEINENDIQAEMVESVRKSIGADSLGYVSLEATIAATHQSKENLCTACLSGEYPLKPQKIQDSLFVTT